MKGKTERKKGEGTVSHLYPKQHLLERSVCGDLVLLPLFFRLLMFGGTVLLCRRRIFPFFFFLLIDLGGRTRGGGGGEGK